MRWCAPADLRNCGRARVRMRACVLVCARVCVATTTTTTGESILKGAEKVFVVRLNTHGAVYFDTCVGMFG